MKIFTKESLIASLLEIREKGWIPNARSGNVGGIGNTIEDLLGIEENNLPIPNASEWELKCQRKETTSLTTLFHMEPSPRALKFVPQILLPKYGWAHQLAGDKYSGNEMSFRQTIHGLSRSDRGFKVVVDRNEKKILISFDAKTVDNRHLEWLKSVKDKIGLDELNPQPYWGFNDLFHKAGTKLLNCFYVQAETKKIDGKTHFFYSDIMILQGLSLENFFDSIENGQILVDFDARTGHNHGTKFRLRQNALPALYSKVQRL
ncbi:MAG: MvaI/BcnI restriction endonuclease family protein [Desulfobacteraceae bacterium]|nr:MvaI/BcnI restriction endonuclease family protein [Desulfobacteraceae bacterium]MBC2720399.1 MvaI/BcnI restriction endonuclease family protein [Desulfobacteraceae bacterium]